MFKHSVVGGLSPFLGILVLASACLGGEIGDAAGVSRLGPGDDGSQPVAPGTQVAPACLGASPDVSASNGWRSSEAALPASDSLYFEFKARPAAANLDGLVGVGAEDIDDFTKAAIAVRFAVDGLVDARDGSFYSSDVSYPYDPGVWYTVAISADISTETYDVAIGPCGEPRETLIKDATFRYDANVSDQLTTWAVWSSQAAALELSTPTWMASGGCAPATCQSLGHECGQPSNGCGGSLNCGGCGTGEACASGLCVDAPASVPPPPPPGDGSRPWAHNTGPSNPGALTPYTGPSTITTDGAVYENFSKSGSLTIAADNVTIRNFTISNGGLYALRTLSGVSGFYAEDGEISTASSALVYDLGSGSTYKRLHLHDANKDGMTMHGSGVLVEGCFVEKIGMGVDTHPDAVANGATSSSNQTFRGNNFFVPDRGTPGWPGDPYDSNSVFIFNDEGTYSNIVIDGNWINGGNYSVYCSTGMRVTNNLFGRDYNFGVRASHKGGSCVWTNNRWEDTGGPI